MKKIHLIKFSFGTNVHRTVPIEQVKYLAIFFSKFFKLEYSIDETQTDKFKTIPISYKRISNSSDVLAKKVIELLTKEYKLINNENKFISTDDLVVVDIKSNFRDTAILYLSSALETILKIDSENEFPRFVILIENIPSTIERFKSIENYIKSGKVLLIDKKKRFCYKEESVKVNKEFSFDILTKSSLDKTKFKLIRKIGHYGRYDDTTKNDLVACNQFFYDGRDCVQDISDVLFEKIVALKTNTAFNATKIIFDCPESPWLGDSILLLDSELKALKADYDFNYTDFHNISEINTELRSQEKILFIIDLIHSASVFKKWFKFLKQHYPNSEIKSLSIMVSDTNKTFIDIINDNTAVVEISQDERIEVDFFLLVNQERYDKAKPCVMCNELHMEIIKDSGPINANALTSFEAWTMCDEAGYDIEDFVTDRESPFPNQVPLLPNRLELIKENSAYLALKYIKYIENNDLLESPDLILVFPDETSSKVETEKRKKAIQLEDTASGYFAETLMQLKEVEYFGIPREILDKIILEYGKTLDLSFILKDHKEFYKKLLLLTEDIIIMDEFGLSGTTLNKIIAVLDIVKKKPKAYFPIFNFNPKNLNTQDAKKYQVMSLYDFNLKVY